VWGIFGGGVCSNGRKEGRGAWGVAHTYISGSAALFFGGTSKPTGQKQQQKKKRFWRGGRL